MQISDELRSKFEALKKPCIQITAHPVAMNEIATGESRFGGVPDVPVGFVWPEADGQPLHFIAQLHFSEVAKYDREGLLPSEGHLFVFYEGGMEAWGFRPGDDRFWKIVYVEEDVELTRTAPPSKINDFVKIKPGRLTFTAGQSYASPADLAAHHLPESDRNLYFDFLEQARAHRRSHPSHQLLGHSDNVQGDMRLECQLTSNGIDCGGPEGYHDPRVPSLKAGAADWILLLQFDTDGDLDIMWGDVGMIYIWIRKQELAARRFEKARICSQCC